MKIAILKSTDKTANDLAQRLYAAASGPNPDFSPAAAALLAQNPTLAKSFATAPQGMAVLVPDVAGFTATGEALSPVALGVDQAVTLARALADARALHNAVFDGEQQGINDTNVFISNPTNSGLGSSVPFFGAIGANNNQRQNNLNALRSNVSARMDTLDAALAQFLKVLS
jgi:phage tail protein X